MPMFLSSLVPSAATADGAGLTFSDCRGILIASVLLPTEAAPRSENFCTRRHAYPVYRLEFASVCISALFPEFLHALASRTPPPASFSNSSTRGRRIPHPQNPNPKPHDHHCQSMHELESFPSLRLLCSKNHKGLKACLLTKSFFGTNSLFLHPVLKEASCSREEVQAPQRFIKDQAVRSPNNKQAMKSSLVLLSLLLVGSSAVSDATMSLPALDSVTTSSMDSPFCAFATKRPELRAPSKTELDEEHAALRSTPHWRSLAFVSPTKDSVSQPSAFVGSTASPMAESRSVSLAEAVFDRISVVGGVVVLGFSALIP